MWGEKSGSGNKMQRDEEGAANSAHEDGTVRYRERVEGEERRRGREMSGFTRAR